MVQKTIEISLLQFIDKVLPYVVGQRQIPMVLRGPRQFLDKVDMPVVATTGRWECSFRIWLTCPLLR